jgi:hypothetical protein
MLQGFDASVVLKLTSEASNFIQIPQYSSQEGMTLMTRPQVLSSTSALCTPEFWLLLNPQFLTQNRSQPPPLQQGNSFAGYAT